MRFSHPQSRIIYKPSAWGYRRLPNDVFEKGMVVLVPGIEEIDELDAVSRFGTSTERHNIMNEQAEMSIY